MNQRERQPMRHNRTLTDKSQVRLPAQASRDLRKRETKAEERLWSRLRDRRLRRLKFRRQHRIPGTVYVVDFYCHQYKLVIELDGPIHDNQADTDTTRQQEIEALGYRVLRFTNQDLFGSLDAVLSTILKSTEV
jgi:very-short-patch-repair endonuclease